MFVVFSTPNVCYLSPCIYVISAQFAWINSLSKCYNWRMFSSGIISNATKYSRFNRFHNYFFRITSTVILDFLVWIASCVDSTDPNWQQRFHRLYSDNSEGDDTSCWLTVLIVYKTWPVTAWFEEGKGYFYWSVTRL